MTGQRVDVDLGPHVPHARRRVAAAADQNVDGRVQGEAVDGRKVAVIVSDNLESNFGRQFD